MVIMGYKKLLKTSIIKTFSIPPFPDILRRHSVGGKILLYHGVEFEITNPFIQQLHIPFNVFEEEIKYLKNNFEIISIDYLNECISNDYKLNPSQFVISFDDGYKNNVEVVLPLLKAESIPFAVFISTNHIEKGDRFPTYILRVAFFENNNDFIRIPSIAKNIDISTEKRRMRGYRYVRRFMGSCSQKKVNDIITDITESIQQDKWPELNRKYLSDEPMNWDEVEKLYNSGVSIGSHCHDHFILNSNQSNEEVERQLGISKIMIEKHLGECKYIAYPNGTFHDISAYSYNIIKDIYSLGLTNVPGELTGTTDMDKYLLPRIVAPYDIEHFKFVINSSFITNRIYRKQYNEFLSKIKRFN